MKTGTVRIERRAGKMTNRVAGWWLVYLDGEKVGHLEKYADSRTSWHPWKAFNAKGEHLGSFYGHRKGWEDAHAVRYVDPKQAAVNAVLASI